MTEPDESPDESKSKATITRRDAIATLAAAGALGATASAVSSSNSTDESVGVGGGPMSDELSHLNIRWYQGPEADLPEPGVEGRYFKVTSGGALWSTGDVLEDTGSSWEKVDLGVENFEAGSASIGEQQITGELDRTPGSGGGYAIFCGGHYHYPNNTRTADDRVLLYDIKKDEWQDLARMNYGHREAVIAEHNGYIWVFGGDRYSGDKVERYDIATDTWEEMTPLDTARSTRLSSNGVVIDGNVYICGGGSDGSNRYKTVEKYDLDNETVEYVSDMPVSHSFPMQAKHDGYLWLITGNSDEDYGGHIQRYDPSTDTWEGPDNFVEHPYNVTDGAGVQIDDEFHFLGGWNAVGGENRDPAGHYKYLMDSDEWQLVRELPTTFSHGKSVWDGEYVWRFMGRMQHGKEAFTNSAWRYHLEQNQESTATPAPQNAHNMNVCHVDQRPYGR